jgi:hypothetical protein
MTLMPGPPCLHADSGPKEDSPHLGRVHLCERLADRVGLNVQPRRRVVVAEVIIVQRAVDILLLARELERVGARASDRLRDSVAEDSGDPLPGDRARAVQHLLRLADVVGST